MILRCACCSHSQTFVDLKEAFNAGWDTPDRFGFTLCDLCPASLYVMKKSHESVHRRWAQEGRPAGFTLESCLEPEDRPDPAEFEAFKEKLMRLLGKK